MVSAPTDEVLESGCDSVPLEVPDGVGGAVVVMDWKDGKIVSLEVLDASKLLHPRPARSRGDVAVL